MKIYGNIEVKICWRYNQGVNIYFNLFGIFIQIWSITPTKYTSHHPMKIYGDIGGISLEIILRCEYLFIFIFILFFIYLWYIISTTYGTIKFQKVSKGYVHHHWLLLLVIGILYANTCQQSLDKKKVLTFVYSLLALITCWLYYVTLAVLTQMLSHGSLWSAKYASLSSLRKTILLQF